MSSPAAPQRKLVACLADFPFLLRGLRPVAERLGEWFVTSSTEEIVARKPDIVLVNNADRIPELREVCDRFNGWVVGLRHGAANKYIGPDPEYALADYFCGSEWDREDFARHKLAPLRRFLVTGNPWMDDIFRIPCRPLNREAPTILFAPTYNVETSAAVFFGDRLVSSIREVYPDSRIIIKPHPLMLNTTHAWVRRQSFATHFDRIVDGYRRAVARDSRVTLVADSSRPISEFYADADILVSDGSSLVFEFMTLERPILLYQSGARVEKWNAVWDADAPANAMRDVGVEFSTLGQFQTALAEAFATHDTRVLPRQRTHAEAMYGHMRDGRSAERAAVALAAEPDLSIFVLPTGSPGAQLASDAQSLLRNRRVLLADDRLSTAGASTRLARLASDVPPSAPALKLHAGDDLPDDATAISRALRSRNQREASMPARIWSLLSAPDEAELPSVDSVFARIVPQTITWLRHRGVQSVCFYGAGTHTERLVPLWRSLDGPSIRAVLTTTAGARADLNGVPVVPIHRFDSKSVQAIVLSSQSHEQELAEISEERWPDLAAVRLYWHPTCSIVGGNRDFAADSSNFVEQRSAV